jgi:NCS1 family nucleobase:cation symporter-1
LITGIIGILIQPWRLVADPSGYIYTWLIAYSALLGAIGGILIADYYLVRRTNLNLADLYRAGGEYWYRSGWNWRAMVALMLGILPCIPGFLGTIMPSLSVAPFWMQMYHYAWFLSFAIAAAAYYSLMRSFRV